MLKTLVASTLVLLAHPCLANRARNLVLGAGDAGYLVTGGALHYDSIYNVFYNPAYLPDSANWAVIEKSNYPGVTAQGGLTASIASVSAGFFFNRVSAVAGPYVNAAHFRPLDFMLAADFGVKFGLGVSYGAYDSRSSGASDRSLALRGGLSFNELAPFFEITPYGTQRVAGSTSAVRHAAGGMRYRWGDWVPYAGARLDRQGRNATAIRYGGGLGRSSRMGDAVNLMLAVGGWHDVADGHTTLPVDLGLEADATSWLVLRGGLTYRALERRGGDSEFDSTTGRLGAAFKFSKVSFDFAAGKSATALEAPVSADAQNFDFGDGLFTAASLTYKW